MPKSIKQAIEEKKENKPTSTRKTKVQPSVRKLKMLVTVVDRSKTLFYLDLLEQFEVNVQFVLYGKGTASTQMINLLGLVEADKSAIISYVREDRVKEALDVLSEKFLKVKNGKGIAFAVPLDSIIGVSMYQLLSNDQTQKEGGKK
ncbi:MAG: hypothetical protein E7358_01210 [Clostridiales bacterium]|jgi:hypothetical protein|nr:hypothetical protein [Clostridiales bacterium]